MNSLCIIGTVSQSPEFIETTNGNTVAKVVLDVYRNFPNSAGEIESEQFQVQLWKGMAEQIRDCMKPGMLIGVRGRLVSNNWEKQSGETAYSAAIIAENVSFLHAKK